MKNKRYILIFITLLFLTNITYSHDRTSAPMPDKIKLNFKSDSDIVRRNAVYSLHYYHNQEADSFLVKCLSDSSIKVITAALSVIEHCHQHLWQEDLMSLGYSKSPEMKQRIANLASQHFLYKEKSREILIDIYNNPKKYIQETAIKALRNQRLFCHRRNIKWWGPNIKPPKWLIEMFGKDYTREKAIKELYLHSGDLADSLVIQALSDDNPRVISAALNLIARGYSHLWNEDLMSFADSKDNNIREVIAKIAQQHFLHSSKARNYLLSLLSDHIDKVKNEARKALENQKLYCKNRSIKWWYEQ